MTAFRYYRLNITDIVAAVNYTQVRNLELASTPGGANLALTGSGTASASQEYSTNYAANAFDTDADTTWQCNNNLAFPQWLQWDFGSPTVIAEARIIRTYGAGYNASMQPKDGTIQGSNDATNWTTLSTFAGLAGTVDTTTTLALMPPTADANITLPFITLVATTGGNARTTLPALTAQGSAGGNVQVTGPSVGALAYSGANLNATLSPVILNMVGHNSTGDRAFDGTMPALTMTGHAGANAPLVSPPMGVSASGRVVAMGNAQLTAPVPTLDATGTTSVMGSGPVSLPMATLVGYAGAVCSITLDGSPTVSASATSGSIGGAAITLPLFDLVASGSRPNHGSAALIAPAARMGATIQAYIAAPSARLTAVGHAVVTATYEAYAVNLKHQPIPGKEPVDEVTRYTNFPFTHIVRYKNSYFGANSTGLYLLDGTTDYATPTPTPVSWAFKTALMDFKSPYQKTVASAYFGGRLGAADTITLYAGEGAGTAYSYTTPRGALAQNHRQAFGKGIKQHRYYAVGANGTDVLELDTIGLDVHLMTRKV